MHQLALRLIAKAKASNDPLDEPLRALDWWYPEDELGEPQMEAVLAEINGWYTEYAQRPRPSHAMNEALFSASIATVIRITDRRSMVSRN